MYLLSLVAESDYKKKNIEHQKVAISVKTRYKPTEFLDNPKILTHTKYAKKKNYEWQ